MLFTTFDDFMANYTPCGCGEHTCETCLNYGVSWIEHRLNTYYRPTTRKVCEACGEEVTFTDVLIRNVCFERWYPDGSWESGGKSCMHPTCCGCIS